MPKKNKKRSKGSAPANGGAAEEQREQRAVDQRSVLAKHDQELPHKMQCHFKLIVKCYEMKQFKKGIKTADLILKKFPHHGETMAMKGLILNCLDRREEGLEFVKTGLRHNIKSHVCWHVFGLFHRSARDYSEAIKCYLNALRIDSDNVQILRDLSLLQIQQRDLKGFQETRRRILLLQPGNRLHWLAFSVGSHLNGDLDKALEILSSYENILAKEHTPDYELSEMLLYKNSIINELGNDAKTLKHIEEISNDVLDSLFLQENRGRLLLRLGDLESAKSVFNDLLRCNSENISYHRGFRMAHGFGESVEDISESDLEALLALYTSLQEQYPLSHACVLQPLRFVSGSRFCLMIAPLLATKLNKGVMSLFEVLRSIYCANATTMSRGIDDEMNDSAIADMGKVEIVMTLLRQFVEELRLNGRFQPTEQPNSASSQAQMWTLYCIAQHLDYLGKHEEALEFVDEALQLSPDEIDVIVLKGDILQHAGDLKGGYEMMESARVKDLGDRFLNTKCVKFALRVGFFEEAERTVALFLRDGDNLISLFDMQCMWYELAAGQAYLAQGQIGRALKKLTSVVKHFADIHEDQFDFHTYCFRKMTLRSYVKTLKFEDNLRGHRFFVAAAQCIVRAYLELHELRLKKVETTSSDDLSRAATDEEKRIAAKAKRAAIKAKLKAEKADSSSSSSNGSNGQVKESDQDPNGEKLAATTDPLGDATDMMKVLLRYAPNDIETNLLAIRLYTLKGKPLLVLRALRRAWSLDNQNDDVQFEIVSFFLRMKHHRASMDDITVSVIDLERDELVGGAGIEAFANALLEQKSSMERSLKASIFVARLQVELASDKVAAQAQAREFLQSFDFDDLSLDLCVEAEQFLRRIHQCTRSFCGAVLQHFPRSQYFQRLSA